MSDREKGRQPTTRPEQRDGGNEELIAEYFPAKLRW
jgi:hypothetical protein